MTEGYEADGWLGLLLGTSMWYGFYGETLSSASVFESRMDAVCREIGSRGRADAVVIDSTADTRQPEPGEGAIDAAVAAVDRDDVAALRLELQGMKIMALHKRALLMGVSAEMVDEAMDAQSGRHLPIQAHSQVR